MSDNARVAAIGVVGIIFAYWALAIGVRNAFGVHLPDPAELLPLEWRAYLP